MSTYEQLKGLKVKYLSADTSGDRLVEGELFYNSTDFGLKSHIAVSAWSAGGNLITSVFANAGAGTQTAGLGFGGYIAGGSNRTNETVEYNGSGWTIGGNLSNSPASGNGAGTQTAGLAFGGAIPPGTNNTNVSQEYNGTAWTGGGNMSDARRSIAGAGTQTAGLGFGGYSPGNDNETEEYDGSSWTAGGNLVAANAGLEGTGLQTAAIAFGGGDPSVSAVAQYYNGSSWTAVTSMNTARTNLGSAGTQTLALAFGGDNGSGAVNNTETWDGSTWTEGPNLATGRQNLGGIGATSSAAVAFGGQVPSPASSLTEEWNVTTSTITGAAWAAGGNTANTRRNAGCMGTQTATLYAGGFGPPYLDHSEEYNGTAWTEGNNLTIARECSTGGFGTQTAGALAGGGAPDNISSPYDGYSNSTDEYNGTSWSEGGDINSNRLGMATCGTQTAGFGAGGYRGANHPASPPSNTTECEQYDGTSWTEVADLNTAKSSCGHFGTQTASIAIRGAGNNTESWNGSTWTNLSATVGAFNGGNHGAGTQASGLVFGPRSGNHTEEWNGTNWVTNVSYSTTRGGNSAGTSSSAILVGGFTGSANSNATEEFTNQTVATTAKSIDFD